MNNSSILIAAALRMSAPLLFAGMGGLISEKSGVVNIALEGIMVAGAFFGVLGAHLTGNSYMGILFAIIAGAVVGLMHAFMCITMRTDQVIAGAAINVLTPAITSFLIFRVFGKGGSTDIVKQVPYNVPEVIRELPIIGTIISEINLFVLLAFVMVFILSQVLYKTSLGLRLRAIGEHPKAADTLGVKVNIIRYVAVIFSGVLAGIGGATLSLSSTPLFVEGMVSGRGFIALAAVVFGKWKPSGMMFACLLFGFADSLQIQAQSFGWSMPSQFYAALPYILTLIMMILFSKGSQPPLSCGIPYNREASR